MFDLVRNHKRLSQIILGLIIIPFALFGLESYKRVFSNDDVIAEVSGVKITRQEFAKTLQEQQDQMRRMLGRNYDPAMLESAQARQQILDGLINQKLLALYAAKGKLLVSDAELQQSIAALEPFQENGRFSKDRYQLLLRAQGMTPESFQESFRQDLTLQRLNTALVDSSITSKSLDDRMLGLLSQQREVAETLFTAEQFASQVKLAPDAAEAYYKANPREFEVPEQVRAEYVVLNRDSIGSQQPVSPNEVKKYYDENFAKRFQEREAARKKAESILSELSKMPDRFAELAKINSQDPGSAENGGDLGFFGRGAMVKPFEEAVFKLKPKQVSDIVETEFGFHIIRLDEIKSAGAGEERRASHILIAAPAAVKDFGSARAEIERDLMRQKAAADFPKMAEKFAELADQQQDSLKPFADTFKLPVQTSRWISRAPSPALGALNNARLLDTLFRPESIKTHQNTEAVEVGPGVLVVARVLEHKPAAVRPLDEVRADIQRMLVQKEAAALAQKAGAGKLAELKQGQTQGLQWSAAKTVSRDDPASLSREAVAAVFRADAAKPPAYAGLELGDRGFAIYRINKIIDAPAADAAKLAAGEASLSRAIGRDQFQAFLAGMRSRAKVEINPAALEKKSQ